MSDYPTPPEVLYPTGQRLTEFEDDAGRQLTKGDFIRVSVAPQTHLFKIRHLFRSPNGTCWIDAYGPYDRYGNINPSSAGRYPKYRSFRVDTVTAKCRGVG